LPRLKVPMKRRSSRGACARGDVAAPAAGAIARWRASAGKAK
jgi:hypothetical protein